MKKLFAAGHLAATMDGHVWVPIDDHHCWVYNFAYTCSPDEPLLPEYAAVIEELRGRGTGELTPDFRPTRNRSNDYDLDRHRQKNGRFTGI